MDNELLFSLSCACCISGAGNAADIVEEKSAQLGAEVTRDNLGNVIARLGKKDAQRTFLLEAHLDEVGFIVTAIDEDGFLHIAKVGGPDIRVLLGEEVTVHSKEKIFGIVCCRPPHLSSKEDYKIVPKLDEIAVDIGFSHDKATEKVRPGDYVTFKRTPKELLGGSITGKSFDNRAGCAAVLRTLEILKEKMKELDCNICAAFTLHEELGGQGSKTAAFACNPDFAIVVDVSFGYTEDAPREKCGDMGKGPMIGISPILSREVTDMLFETAKEMKIPFQTEVMGSSTGTNADTVTVTREGVKTGLVSVPLRYMHTASETIVPEDVENTARLIAQTVGKIGGKAE